LVILFEDLKMHGTTNHKFINAKQARDIYAYPIKDFTTEYASSWLFYLKKGNISIPGKFPVIAPLSVTEWWAVLCFENQ
jgi:hypothetical protein